MKICPNTQRIRHCWRVAPIVLVLLCISNASVHAQESKHGVWELTFYDEDGRKVGPWDYATEAEANRALKAHRQGYENLGWGRVSGKVLHKAYSLDVVAGKSKGATFDSHAFRFTGRIHPHVGLLGMNFLEHFRIDLDFKTGEIFNQHRLR